MMIMKFIFELELSCVLFELEDTRLVFEGKEALVTAETLDHLSNHSNVLMTLLKARRFLRHLPNIALLSKKESRQRLLMFRKIDLYLREKSGWPWDQCLLGPNDRIGYCLQRQRVRCFACNETKSGTNISKETIKEYLKPADRREERSVEPRKQLSLFG